MTPKDRAFAALRYEWRAHRSVWLGLAFAVTLLGVLHGALTGDLLGGVFLGLGALSLLAALLLAFLSLSLSKLFPKAQRRGPCPPSPAASLFGARHSLFLPRVK